MIGVICKTKKGNRPCHSKFIYKILPIQTIMIKDPKKKRTKFVIEIKLLGKCKARSGYFLVLFKTRCMNIMFLMSRDGHSNNLIAQSE